VDKSVILLFVLVLALRGAAGAAVVTSPAEAAVTVVASASIGSDGTIIAQDGSRVSSVFVASDGLYELALSSATFTKPANYVANVQSVEVPAFANAVSSGAPHFLYVATWKSGKPTPEDFDLICEGDGPKPAPRKIGSPPSLPWHCLRAQPLLISMLPGARRRPLFRNS
jgi:hypothetical protein